MNTPIEGIGAGNSGNHLYRQVKVCGLTNYDDALAAVNLGADLLGMVMHPKSPRFCKSEDAKTIVKMFPFKPTVLVFADNEVNFASDIINDIAGEFTLFQAPYKSRVFDWLIQHFPVGKILPVYSIKNESILLDKDVPGQETPEQEILLEGIRQLENVPWIIFDTGGVISKTGETLHGGTGQTFNWDLVSGLGRHFFIAGGLTPENILQAVHISQAGGFDVSGGLEVYPGKKDIPKMKSFIGTIRRAQDNSDHTEVL